MSQATQDVTDQFAKDNQALIDAANQYKKDYEKYKADKAYYHDVVLAKLQGQTGDPFVFLALVLQAFTSDGSASSDEGGKRADGTITGLYEDQIGLNGDSIAVMAALTKCGNDIEKASDDRTGTTDDLRKNAHAMDILLDETSKGGILNPDDSSMAPIDPEAIKSYGEQIKLIRDDIFIKGDDKYNPDKNPSSADGWKRTYHLSDDGDAGESQSYGELYTNSQIQGEGTGLDDKSKGARDAMSTMTNAFQVNTSSTQTMNSGYNLIENNLTKQDQTALSFISEMCHASSQVVKTIVNNSH